MFRFASCVLVAMAWTCGVAAGCLQAESDVPPAPASSIRGQVIISGGVRGARLSVDRLNARGEILSHIGDAVTDDAGRFVIELETGTEHGLFRFLAQGGSYQDLVTGATVELDTHDELVSLIRFGLLPQRDDALVSPIGHMVEARTLERFRASGDLMAAFDETRASLHHHFGNVDWDQVIPWPLDRPAPSPTEPVRAAFVLAALSVLAHDIALDAGAGPQEASVYRLMQRWTEDVRADTFDGNDSNNRAPGSGLQLGFCMPVASGCVMDAGCSTGQCRVACDLYSGTARAMLAGAMVKVINDPRLNRTGIDLSNTLSIVRAVADDTDPNLFDASCLEALDRTSPSVRFDLPTPAEAAFVRGLVTISATASDDIDASPDTSLVGFVDLDGDSRDATASTLLDTSAHADGPIRIIARAVDLAGNTATAERSLTIDNTAPGLSLSASGFFDDGNTWWTASAAPVLTGTIADIAPAAIKAVIAGRPDVVGTIAGTSWTITLPAGALDPAGTQVEIVATDTAGNQARLSRRLRPDVEPPALSFQPSTVIDEADDWISFAADHSPQHAHLGSPVDLSAAGCPTVTKFSYLLGPTSPEYVLELPGPAPNPLRYQFVTDDPGVGIAPASTEYRVGWRPPSTPSDIDWVLDWTLLGPGTPIGTGVTRFPVSIFSNVVPGLATKEGDYVVEFRATDRLARPVSVARCFHLTLRAPPLELEPLTPGTRSTKDHAYALDSLSLAPGAQYDQIAARLLNDTATGASLIDQDAWNGTTSTIYLTVTVTPPQMVMVAQRFAVGNAPTNVIRNPPCFDNCPVPSMLPTEYTAPQRQSHEDRNLQFPIKVFELVNGQPTLELPCLAPCSLSDRVFKFELPPRLTGGHSARAFRVMTMIGQITGLWPRDFDHIAPPPFVDDGIVWTNANNETTLTRLTGLIDTRYFPQRTGCVSFGTVNGVRYCRQLGTMVPYQVLIEAILTFSQRTSTRYETAAATDSTPATVGERERRASENWTTSEGDMP
jgi:hypothetical protein